MNPICMLLTVGSAARGQPAPAAKGLIHTLQRLRPVHFLLLPGRSRDSLAVAKQVLRGLDAGTRAAFVAWSDEQPFLCIERPGQMESARATVREAIGEVRRRFPDEVVAIHPQSGTRPAVAGALLAALDEGVGIVEFSGGPREEEGEGAEPKPEGAAPKYPSLAGGFDAARWRAEHELVHAVRAWDQQQFGVAAAMLHVAGAPLPARDPWQGRLAGLALAAEGFAAKEAFWFAVAEKKLLEARAHWHPDRAECPVPLRELARTCKEAADRCARFAKLQGGERQLPLARDLLAETVDQSIRAGRAERYEEACSRLARAMEMELQLRFAEATGGNIWNGRLTKGGKVPEALRSASLLAQLQRTELPREWSMEAIVHALHALGDPRMTELWQDLTDRRGQSEWRLAWTVPGGSVFGHGCVPVDKAGHKTLRRAAGRFLGLQLTESHPLPAFDRKWLLAMPESPPAP